MTTNSPSRGGGSPPHVNRDDHKSIYSKYALFYEYSILFLFCLFFVINKKRAVTFVARPTLFTYKFTNAFTDE